MKKLFLIICILCTGVLSVHAEEEKIRINDYNKSIRKAGVPVMVPEVTPSRYDPRENKMVADHMEDQADTGLCWDYAAVAAAESAMIKQGLADESVNLSELEIAYRMWKDNYAEDSYKDAFGYGNDSLEAVKIMASGTGPAEETLSVQDYEGQELSEEQLYHSLYDIEQIYYSRAPENIKQMIQSYGGVIGCYYSYSPYYLSNPCGSGENCYNNTGDSTYYFPHKTSFVNHTVEIVGWDDNYPKENFKKQPSHNGAWLIKNSWGTEYKTDLTQQTEDYCQDKKEEPAPATGYYWVSYDDTGITSCSAIAMSLSHKDTHVKQIKAEDIIMHSGETTVLQTAVKPEGMTADYTVKTDNPEIVQTDASGRLTAGTPGVCKITLYSKDTLDVQGEVPRAETELTVTVLEPEKEPEVTTTRENPTTQTLSATEVPAATQKPVTTAEIPTTTKVPVTATQISAATTELLRSTTERAVTTEQAKATESCFTQTEPSTTQKSVENSTTRMLSAGMEQKDTAAVSDHVTEEQKKSDTSGSSPARTAAKTIRLSKQTYTYDGRKKCPKIMNNGKQAEYSVKYRRNKKVGKAEVLITLPDGKHITKYFTIIPRTPVLKNGHFKKQKEVSWYEVKKGSKYVRTKKAEKGRIYRSTTKAGNKYYHSKGVRL